MGWGFGETIGFVGWRIYFFTIGLDVFKPSNGFMMFLLQGAAQPPAPPAVGITTPGPPKFRLARRGVGMCSRMILTLGRLRC